MYKCTEILYEGLSMRPEELYEGEISLKLITGGKGKITLGTEGGSIDWQLDGEKLSIDINGDVSLGVLHNDIITLELYDSGAVLTFVKEGSAAAKPTPGNDSQALSGSWYGWWKISSAQGGWAGYDGMWFDLCATIEFDENSEGRIKLWDEDYSADDPMALVYLKLYENGTAISQNGYLIGCKIKLGEWILDKSMQSYDELLSIKGKYTDAEGSFDYELVLRPWGISWDDIAEENSDMLPYYYEKWYLPLAEAGEAMPDRIVID